MIIRRAFVWVLLGAGSAIACGSDENAALFTTAPDGGGAGSGGVTSSGGRSSTGGNAATGGNSSNGGSPGSGGTTGSGGATSTGGSKSSGGAGGSATGGAPSSGGAASTGGISSTGGATSTGGISSTGGATSTGGISSTGGVTSTGGVGGTGGAGATGGAMGTGGTGGSPLGTYVSGTVGNDTNPGTQALPVRTIAQGLANAQSIGGGVPVFVAQGHYPEKVTLVEGVSLLGGHQCDTSSCTWARDPATYDTAILDQDAEGVLADDSITNATSIDGFRIMGQNGGNTGRGRVSMTLRGSPTVKNDRVFGPDVTGNTGVSGRSIAILLPSSNTTQGPLIESNTITGGQSVDQSVGIAFETATTPSAATIRKNVIVGGTGSGSAGIAASTSSASTLVEDNDISTGSATTFSAWAISLSSMMTINANRINVANTTAACQSGNQNPCGGINSASSTSTITNNVVFGVVAPRSVGVRLMESEVPGGVVVLNSNTIDGGGTPSNSGSGTSTSAALIVEIGACTTCGFNGFVGHVRNNILTGGVADARFAVYEQAPAGKTQHPEILENNDLYVESPTNKDALYRSYDGTNQTLITSISGVNGLASIVTVGANISGAPMLDTSFDLVLGSPCIDVGTSSEAPVFDKNGLARPQNGIFDIGADEY